MKQDDFAYLIIMVLWSMSENSLIFANFNINLSSINNYKIFISAREIKIYHKD